MSLDEWVQLQGQGEAPIFSAGAWRACFAVPPSPSGAWQVRFAWCCYQCGPSLLDQAMRPEETASLCVHARCKIAGEAFWVQVDNYAFWLRLLATPEYGHSS